MMRDISLHITDIVQNSIAAGAENIKIKISTDTRGETLFVCVTDDGCGMSEEFAQNATDPFITSRTTRNVGLGIPLFKLSGEIAGGDFSLCTQRGKGTSISVSYNINNINRIPLGDIGDAVTASIMTDSEINFELYLDNGSENFSVSTKEISEKLKGVPLTNVEVLGWIKEYINENVYNIFHGILEEIQ